MPSFQQTYGYDFASSQDNFSQKTIRESNQVLTPSQAQDFSQDMEKNINRSLNLLCGQTPNVHKKINESTGGLIFGSINLLNDIELSQELFSPSQKSDQPIKSLSRNQSFCSVVSLDKVYRNLDVNSNENIDLEPKIPSQDELVKLFNNHVPIRSAKPVAMSLEFGDVGFNRKYSDFIKTSGPLEEFDVGADATISKILELFPKENEKIKI